MAEDANKISVSENIGGRPPWRGGITPRRSGGAGAGAARLRGK